MTSFTSYKDLGYGKVFVALDGSDQTDAVLERAIIVAANNRAELIVGHVIDTTALESVDEVSDTYFADREADFMASIEARLEQAREMPEVASVRVVIEPGRVRETLKEKMLDIIQPDIVMCGARGLSNIKYALLGSISTFLLRNCDCDILVVK